MKTDIDGNVPKLQAGSDGLATAVRHKGINGGNGSGDGAKDKKGGAGGDGVIVFSSGANVGGKTS